MYKEKKTVHVPVEAVRWFLEGIQKAPRKSYPSLELGENIRAKGPFVSGAALVHNGALFHLSSFAHEEKKDEEPRVPYQRFSQRGNGVRLIYLTIDI